MTKFKVATLFGIPIYLDLTLGILMGYIVLFFNGPIEYRLLMAIMFPVSILFHELAHSLVGMLFGGRILAIHLYLLGGAALLSELPRKPWQEAVVAFAGPLMSFVLAGLFYGVLVIIECFYTPITLPRWMDLPVFLCYGLMWLNLALGTFNLLPAFPLDGGRILRAILQCCMRSRLKATAVAVTVGRVFAVFWFTLWIANTFFDITFDVYAWNCPEWLCFVLSFIFETGGFLLPLLAYMIWVSGMQELRYIELETYYNGDNQ